MMRSRLRNISPFSLFRLSALCATLGVTFIGFVAFATAGECRRDGTQSEINACARDDLARADAKLNALYKKQMTRLTDDANKKNLRAAQKTWVVFRDASCLYEVGERTQTSGSIFPLLYLDCKTAFTNKRVQELKDYLNCTAPEDFCPL